jgi:hypothetical protein
LRANHLLSPAALAALAVLLSLPALGLGLQLDDFYLRLALSDPPNDPAWSRPARDVFAFFPGDPASMRHARDQGTVPWWVDERLRLAFWRPLSGLTHGLDFRAWPDAAAVMHAHSLLWLGACVAAAAALYRRLAPTAAVAGVAGVLFAIDDGHATPAAWLANRNALVATLFALLALAAHDRWRRDGWRAGAWVSPACLLLGLFGGEMAVGAGGYLLAYALFLDGASPRRRVLSLLPCGTVGLMWALAYRALGYGARHSTLYVDPTSDPAHFAVALAERLPILVFGQFALPADIGGVLSEPARRLFWTVCCFLVAAVGVLAWPLLRRDRLARFFAVGMLLSLVPPAATFPSNRLLIMGSFGGAGLLAQWLVAVRERASWLPPPGARAALVRTSFWAALAVHGLLAPLGLLGAAAGVRVLGDVPTRAAATLPTDSAAAGQHWLIVSTPTAFLTTQSLLEHTLAGRPRPAHAHVLGSGIGPTRVTREDERTLLLQPAGGYLSPPGRTARDGAAGPPPFDQHYIFALFDRLYREDVRFERRQRVSLAGVEVEIADLTADGRPAAARFRFDRVLEDPSNRWLAWIGQGYEAWHPPPVGRSADLPPASLW